MNNTTATRALAAIVVLMLTAATLVLATAPSSLTPTATFAYNTKKGARDSRNGDGSNNNNGNTITDQAARQNAEESGFDVTQEQESQM
jgi:hypothetical protein